MKRHEHSYTYEWIQYQKAEECIDVDSNDFCKNVFYYTTVDTFKKIIDSGCMFAGHIKYMNDWQEFNSGYEYISEKTITRLNVLKSQASGYGGNIIREMEDCIKFFQQKVINGYHCSIWENGKEKIYEFGRGVNYYDYAFPQVYNISFTRERDLLSQWKMYARESGVAIEFDFNKVNTFCQKVDNNYCFFENTYPRSVKYATDNETNHLNINDFLCEYKVDQMKLIKLLKMVPFIKNEYYRAEEEARLIFRPFRNCIDGAMIESDIKYREANHVLIPYMEIYCLNQSQEIEWPIVSLTVGPGNNQEVVFSSIIYFVENIYKNVYDFMVGEYIDSFERYYKILIKKLKKELWKGEERVVINPICDSFRNSSKLDEVISQEYCRGKFKSDLATAKEKIYSSIWNITSDEDTGRCREILNQFETDYYLASNGIIIQKSKAPYIFN